MKVITLCGSARFKDEFEKINQELSLEGNVVISITPIKDKITNKQKNFLCDKVHRAKIDISDEIFVINKNGYIGNSTKSEIDYAINKSKKVRYLEPVVIEKDKDTTIFIPDDKTVRFLNSILG